MRSRRASTPITVPMADSMIPRPRFRFKTRPKSPVVRDSAAIERLRPRLAQELQDLIIDHLRDDRDALCDLSLVCRTWCRLCRRYLFPPNRLFYIAFSELRQQLTHALLNSPHLTIAEYVKRIMVGIQPDENAGSILRPLKYLQSVMYLGSWPGPVYGLNKLGPLLGSTPTTMLKELILVNMHMDNMYDFIMLLRTFKTLRHLSLTHVKWNEKTLPGHPEVYKDGSGPITTLKSVILVGDAILIMKWLTSYKRPRGLYQPKIARMDLTAFNAVDSEQPRSDIEQYERDIHGYYRSFGPIIEELDVYQFNFLSQEELDLSQNINLRAIWFHISPDIPFLWTVSALRSITSSHLHTITFRLCHSVGQGGPGWSNQLGHWDEIANALLLNPHFHSSLRTIRFTRCENRAFLEFLTERLATMSNVRVVVEEELDLYRLDFGSGVRYADRVLL